ncbi:glycosyltransferase family 32 protein [Liquorilactobacillus vini]|uniref:Glycosyltransferase n=1 Tax=Liquorilactobacillus vini DSM 20605 TaxID=1133569 RepID=A0A0R2CI41_9LACO|nr:glycosyltransferase [Liquorilactobacillus vini]KRM89668.1 glycosyltransferase [Liquorilactobacillus vini DSM 20605]
MIPKIIHYCWFGSQELPAKYQHYLASWQKKCPDYQIIRWDETNYDVRKNHYMQQAAQLGKWSFVSDYLGFDVVYQYGGIYLDTDVELLKNLDNLLNNQAFMGFEENETGFSIAPGLGFGAQKHDPIFKELCQIYDKLEFVDQNGHLNTLAVPAYTTKFLCQKGLKANNQLQTIAGIKLYPSDYFAPMDFLTGEIHLTKNTYSIHHYSATWQSPENLRHIKIIRQVNRKFGKKLGMKINWFLRASWAIKRRFKAISKH